MSNSNNQSEKIKKIVYRGTNYPGIRSVWEWSDQKNEYVIRKSGNRFIATVEKNNRTRSESFYSIDEAKRWRERSKLEIEMLPNVPRMNFGELLNKYIAHKVPRVQVTTLESYDTRSRHFGPLLNQNVEAINAQTIDGWLAEIKSPKYALLMKVRNTRMSFLREVELLREVFGFYKEYFNEKFENPVRRRHDLNSVVNQEALTRRRQQANERFITIEGIEKLLAVFREQSNLKINRKIYFFIALFQLRTGTRIGEAGAVRWEDINWNTGLLKINKTVQWARKFGRPTRIRDATKTDKPRTIKLIPELIHELKSLQINQGRISGLIFSNDGTHLLSYRCIQYYYGKAFEEAEVQFRSTHILRHSFATAFAELTQDMAALEGTLGHSDPRQTRKYAKITDLTVVRGMDKFGQSLSSNALERART